jgi:hypothetical protein
MPFLLIVIFIIAFVVDALQIPEDGSGEEVCVATLCVFFAPLLFIIAVIVHA